MKAFTVAELLVVIAIVALTAAISAPAISAAKESAQITRCAGNLHQMGIAVSLYREEQGEKVAYGHPIDMGLPPHAVMAVGNNRQLIECSGGRTIIPGYTQFWPAKGWMSEEGFERELRRWLAYVQVKEGATIMLLDDNHNKPNMSDWETFFAIGINFDQAAIRRHGIGFPERPGWWHSSK